MTRFWFLAALITSPALAASPIDGNWTNPKHSVTVHIAACGGGARCGRVIRATPSAKAKAAAAGAPQLIGAELMSNLQPTGGGTWHGSFFVPDRNVRAEGELRLLGPRMLEIEGCAMGGLLCKSQQWTKVGSPAKTRRRR